MLPDALRQRVTAPSSIGVVPFAYGSSLIMQHPLLDSLRALLLCRSRRTMTTRRFRSHRPRLTHNQPIHTLSL
jgi:hypothetical protein